MRLRLARALLVGPLLAAPACGLLASPGEYTGGGARATEPDASVNAQRDGASQGDVVVLPDGQVVAASKGTIVVAAGERDPTSPEDDPAWAADVLSGVLDENGAVVTWRVEKSAPIVGSFDAAELIDGRWATLSFGFGLGGGRGHALQSVGWGPGPAGEWKANRANLPGGLDEVARVFVGAHVVTVGGSRTVAVDGGTSTFLVREVHVADVDTANNQIGAFGDGPTLAGARARPGLLVAGGYLYVAGGRANVAGGITAGVEAAKVDKTAGTLEAFADQPALTANGAEHKVYAPGLVAANGYLYCAGGRTSGGGASTDVVVAAKIDPATGALSPWKDVTKLPKPLRDFGFVAHEGRLYVIGGVAGATRSDEVYSASISGDGSLSAWDTSSNAKLPAKRSDIVALSYR
jgi:hypothetical protein